MYERPYDLLFVNIYFILFKKLSIRLCGDTVARSVYVTRVKVLACRESCNIIN